MTPQEALKSLSPAQLDRLARCAPGMPAPTDLLVFDPPLVLGHGRRTMLGEAVLALHTECADKVGFVVHDDGECRSVHGAFPPAVGSEITVFRGPRRVTAVKLAARAPNGLAVWFTVSTEPLPQIPSMDEGWAQ